MCGYLANLHESSAIIDLFSQLEIPLPYPRGQYYPLRECSGLLTASRDGIRVSKALWWYAMKWENGNLIPNKEITSFNARNLESRMWRKPVNERRALVLATEIGETQDGRHYLMKSLKPLAIGAVYQDYQTDEGAVRAFALITRPATPHFARYHKKAMPLFIPFDKNLIQAWLDPQRPADDPQIKELIESPRMTNDLEVTRVRTFKRAEALGPTEILEPD